MIDFFSWTLTFTEDLPSGNISYYLSEEQRKIPLWLWQREEKSNSCKLNPFSTTMTYSPEGKTFPEL